MITAETLVQIIGSIQEKIELCGELVSRGDCDWDCCKYTDSYILFLPGEWESAIALGYSVSQYTVLDPDYQGGVKAVPSSMGCCVDPAAGERSYKPLDCRIFPFWFEIEGESLVLTQGLSCPMVRMRLQLAEQRAQAARVARIIASDSDLVKFLRAARMVNYEVLETVAQVAPPGT